MIKILKLYFPFLEQRNILFYLVYFLCVFFIEKKKLETTITIWLEIKHAKTLTPLNEPENKSLSNSLVRVVWDREAVV